MSTCKYPEEGYKMKVVINYLRGLASGKSPLVVSEGICVNLSDKCYKCVLDAHHLISYHAIYWDKYSGDETYPVPSTDHLTNSDAYWYNIHSNLWIGKYGALRRDLCGFIADRLEAEL